MYVPSDEILKGRRDGLETGGPTLTHLERLDDEGRC